MVSKYRSRGVTAEICGETIKFDSKKEYHRFLELHDEQQRGLIRSLRHHVPFVLLDGYYKCPLCGLAMPYDPEDKSKKQCRDCNCKLMNKIRPITYEADFVYIRAGHTKETVEDVKGSQVIVTDAFKIKKKLFEFKYNYNIDIKT